MKILNNRFFSVKLCLVPRILGAMIFFVLLKEKGNTSGSWASPQEVSLGLIKGTDVRCCGCSYKSISLEITRNAIQEKLELEVSLSR